LQVYCPNIPILQRQFYPNGEYRETLADKIVRFKIEKPKDKSCSHSVGPKLTNYNWNILLVSLFKDFPYDKKKVFTFDQRKRSFLTWPHCIVGFSWFKIVDQKDYISIPIQSLIVK